MRALGLVAVILLSTVASRAVAQADPMWDRGVALRAEGRDAEALAVFEEAHRQSRSARTLAQVALAEQALGRWGEARRHLDEALSRPDPWMQQNMAALQQAHAEIVRRTGLLEVSVDHAGARILIDGREVGRSPMAAFGVTAGTFALRVERNGVVQDRTLTVGPGQTLREQVVLGAAAGGGGGGDALPIVGGILLAVGGLSAAGMGIAWGIREDRAAHYNSDECFPAGRTRDEACGDDRQTVDDATISAIVLGVGAAVFVGAGIGLLVAGSGSGGSASLECTPGLLGVSCRGSF